ncbi:hypothetical protein [Roseateles oligotrophus]|uniref:Solute-binding protein family 3/N-terminal domain-containing protein n=1 Tax=Roseateles oligotrophus TaxID=1769250 RepID=A0ABT2YGC5_9BURK|nr:hypothetical protein [Roseateles oligotrophus]MCV2369097.1 hypothetical protein [Roseateles oligotrophus]
MRSLKNCRIFVLLLAPLLLSLPVRAIDIRVCQAEQSRYSYRMELARLLLARTAQADEVVQLRPYASGPDPTQQRCLALLREQRVDLVYLPPSNALLDEFASIKIDLHKGMLGYRLLLINKKDEGLFAKVQTLADLRQLTAGFGQQWSDFSMFELNQLPVVGVAQTDNLLSMLDRGRFHYFHRGLHEAWAELERNPQLHNLMVEPHLALAYPFPVYFMFNAKDQALKQRFERGFAMVMADGSFDALFMREFGGLARQAQLRSRTIIEINYPVPDKLPKVDSRLWLK